VSGARTISEFLLCLARLANVEFTAANFYWLLFVLYGTNKICC